MSDLRQRIDQIMAALDYSFVGKDDPEARRVEAVADTHIDAFEQRIGLTLPADYRAFLYQYHGVRLYNGFAYASMKYMRHDLEEGTAIDILYGFYQPWGRRSQDLYSYYSVIDRVSDLPSGFVPIGEIPGNLFCVSCAERDYGRVYIVYGSALSYEPALLPLHDSFLDFLAAIRNRPDEDEVG